MNPGPILGQGARCCFPRERIRRRDATRRGKQDVAGEWLVTRQAACVGACVGRGGGCTGCVDLVDGGSARRQGGWFGGQQNYIKITVQCGVRDASSLAQTERLERPIPPPLIANISPPRSHIAPLAHRRACRRCESRRLTCRRSSTTTDKMHCCPLPPAPYSLCLPARMESVRKEIELSSPRLGWWKPSVENSGAAIRYSTLPCLPSGSSSAPTLLVNLSRPARPSSPHSDKRRGCSRSSQISISISPLKAPRHPCPRAPRYPTFDTRMAGTHLDTLHQDAAMHLIRQARTQHAHARLEESRSGISSICRPNAHIPELATTQPQLRLFNACAATLKVVHIHASDCHYSFRSRRRRF